MEGGKKRYFQGLSTLFTTNTCKAGPETLGGDFLSSPTNAVAYFTKWLKIHMISLVLGKCSWTPHKCALHVSQVVSSSSLDPRSRVSNSGETSPTCTYSGNKLSQLLTCLPGSGDALFVFCGGFVLFCFYILLYTKKTCLMFLNKG